ncbi:hypothetical protein [Stutzerimonas stutzeri]|uniref:hypothetical protein n=1 Tax=Stutzerimonas stutzeri TaxID=316 RepID=UPI000F7AC7B7|nr:hypothetical protein [Stutzerimonas stutzeri]RRW19689.1 hypothetical protein EGJ45_07375 [Stutzerimonas stutzeri]RRW25339.1 hypothetical protein EGJ36_09535 [Stutzerimonas stutzeri]
MAAKGMVGRRVDVSELTEEESWDHCVAYLIGPKLVGVDPAIRHRNALELGAAALRAAGEHDLATELLA